MNGQLLILGAWAVVWFGIGHVVGSIGRDDAVADERWHRQTAEGRADGYYRKLHPPVESSVRLIPCGHDFHSTPQQANGCWDGRHGFSAPPPPAWLKEPHQWDHPDGRPILGAEAFQLAPDPDAHLRARVYANGRSAA